MALSAASVLPADPVNPHDATAAAVCELSNYRRENMYCDLLLFQHFAERKIMSKFAQYLDILTSKHHNARLH